MIVKSKNVSKYRVLIAKLSKRWTNNDVQKLKIRILQDQELFYTQKAELLQDIQKLEGAR